MRSLVRIRLVQWYHFQDETLTLNGSCILLGDNGSGKSTILDAVQFALVASLEDVRFNQAANEKGKRTLYGYVRWKLGHEDAHRPDGFRYGRASATSYVLLEFEDPEEAGGQFTAGIVCEATDADQEVSRRHFVIPGVGVQEISAVRRDANGDEHVLPWREFKTWLRNRHAGAECIDVSTYREELRQRLGVLPEQFHRLIVKALSFKPIGQVRQFVFDYLLDPRPVDTVSLQSNLEHYKKLEGEARRAQERVKELEEIVRQGEKIRAERRVAESHRFLELCADLELADAAHKTTDAQIATKEALCAGWEIRRGELKSELASLVGERDRVLAALERHDVYRQLNDLERQLDAAEGEHAEAKRADDRARALLKEQTDVLKRLGSDAARSMRRRYPWLLEDDLVGTEDPPPVVLRLRETLAADGALAGRDLNTWTKRLDGAAETLQTARHHLKTRLDAGKDEVKALEAELRGLEAGRQQYPLAVDALLHLLSAKLHGKREPKVLCELIDVPSPRWRNAVEGYLGSRRFDVVIAPEDFPKALSLYEAHKADYSLPRRGPVFISDVGLVDIEKIQRLSARVQSRSLAEQVDTRDPLARAYCDFALGDVICVEDEKSLRKHLSAITDTVMVYKDHVARQVGREVYSRHFIGKAAMERRTEEVTGRLGELSRQVPDLADDVDWLRETIAAVEKARGDARILPDLTKRASARATLEARAKRLADQKLKLNRTEITELERLRDELSEKQEKAREGLEKVGEDVAGTEAELRLLRPKLVDLAADVVRARTAQEAFQGSLEPDVVAGYQERYQRERGSKTPTEVHEVFERQRRSIESRVQNWTNDLIIAKTRYCDRWGFAGDVSGESVSDFVAEHDLWVKSRLPEYSEKIAGAKERALQRLAEDVVFRLNDNFRWARRQLDDLNDALKAEPFGSERYEFKWDVDPQHRAFHNVVTSAGMYTKDSLFGNVALTAPETRKTLQDLLERLVDAEAAQVKTELEERADYREYYRYDLKIHHADGHYSLYDRVAGDKSGGETQTPYYIAILASMYRLYRSGKGALDGRPTCGLVLLDEAFGKMDEPRIAATLRFARRLGLQLILATPKERSDLVAPRVERAIYVHKDPVSGDPTLFDVTKEFPTDEPERTFGNLDSAARSPRA